MVWAILLMIAAMLIWNEEPQHNAPWVNPQLVEDTRYACEQAQYRQSTCEQWQTQLVEMVQVMGDYIEQSDTWSLFDNQ